MARPKANRDAILVALLDAVGGLPPHFDLERFSDEVERWTSEGKTAQQIARLIVEQCQACASPSEAGPKREALNPDDYYTVEAHDRAGPLRVVESHILGKDVNRAKRRISREHAEDGERLRFVVLREGIEPRRVGEYTKPGRSHRIGSYTKDRR